MKNRFSTMTLAIPALGAAIIATLSQITVPLGTVPFTLQTLSVGLCAYLFRPREATLSVLLYLIMGGIGLPVFAGGSAGFASLIGPQSGFLWGFVLYALITSLLLSARPKANLFFIFIFNVIGDVFVFLGGIISLHYVGHLEWQKTILAGVIPFLFTEVIKLLAITLVSKPLSKALEPISYFSKN